MKNKKLKKYLTCATLLSLVIPATTVFANDAQAADISGRVWFENGPQDRSSFDNNTYKNGEDLDVTDFTVSIRKEGIGELVNGVPEYEVKTDNKGQYKITGLSDGKYVLNFHNPLIWSPVIANIIGATPEQSSDGPIDVKIDISGGQSVNNIDQGYYTASGAIINDMKAPSLEPIEDQTVEVGQSIKEVMTKALDDQKVTLTATGLPEGVSMNVSENIIPGAAGSVEASRYETTGSFSGIPTKPGVYNVTVVATDTFDNKQTINFTITVNEPITEAPTTEAPTTEAPTTEAPTTEAPTTEASTTEAPTTEAPTTEEPTTETPTTEAPTTEAPTTEEPTTEAPTEEIIIEKPTTEAPTTEAPTTEAPTTEAPTTEAPTTEAPTTEAPTTEAPTTEEPTTEKIEKPIILPETGVAVANSGLLSGLFGLSTLLTYLVRRNKK